MYVTVEGIDGSGKTTLVETLAEENGDYEATSEPTDGRLWTGDAAREAIDRDTSPVTDALLQMADRAEHLHRVVLPALEGDGVIVSDRGSDSTYAYQTRKVAEWLDGHPAEWIDAVLDDWDVEPDLTILLDLPVADAVERGGESDEYEAAERLYATRGIYLSRAAREPDRFVVIDATMGADAVAEAAQNAIEDARQ